MPRVPEGYLHERRRQILAAASRVFSKRGVQGATMTEVANEAGISPGLIYRYFPSKDELVTCAMSESTQDLEAQWMEAPDNHPDPLREFKELSQRTFEALSEPAEQQHTVLHLEGLLTAVREGDSAELQAARDNLDAISSKIGLRLRAAQKAGQVDPALDADAFARVAVDFYWGLRLRKMLNIDVDVSDELGAFMQMMDAAYAGLLSQTPARAE